MPKRKKTSDDESSNSGDASSKKTKYRGTSDSDDDFLSSSIHDKSKDLINQIQIDEDQMHFNPKLWAEYKDDALYLARFRYNNYKDDLHLLKKYWNNITKGYTFFEWLKDEETIAFAATHKERNKKPNPKALPEDIAKLKAIKEEIKKLKEHKAKNAAIVNLNSSSEDLFEGYTKQEIEEIFASETEEPKKLSTKEVEELFASDPEDEVKETPRVKQCFRIASPKSAAKRKTVSSDDELMKELFGNDEDVEELPSKTLETLLVKVTQVNRGGVGMRGVVAKKKIYGGTIIGSYKGARMTEMERDRKAMSGYTNRNASKEEYGAYLQQVSSYDMQDPENKEYLFSPTDAKGEILTEYDCVALYVNEPNVKDGEKANCLFQAAREHGVPPELIVMEKATIEAGEELLVNYGSAYKRSYDKYGDKAKEQRAEQRKQQKKAEKLQKEKEAELEKKKEEEAKNRAKRKSKRHNEEEDQDTNRFPLPSVPLTTKFNSLTQFYNELKKEIYQIGQANVANPVHPMTEGSAISILDAMRVNEASVFMDIGCGNGLVVMAARLEFCVEKNNAYGIDINENEIQIARYIHHDNGKQFFLANAADLSPPDWTIFTHLLSFDEVFDKNDKALILYNIKDCLDNEKGKLEYLACSSTPNQMAKLFELGHKLMGDQNGVANSRFMNFETYFKHISTLNTIRLRMSSQTKTMYVYKVRRKQLRLDKEDTRSLFKDSDEEVTDNE